MTRYLFEIRPLSAFASEPTGGMLFGQLAWGLREAFGEARLTELLEGYTAGQPFAVLSGALPHGFVPVPELPSYCWWHAATAQERKLRKALQWLPIEALSRPISEWEDLARKSTDLTVDGSPFAREVLLTHNSISRLTGTTGEGAFAPFDVSVKRYAKTLTLDVYLDLDETRLTVEEIESALQAVGLFGFGRDASTGAGKFEIVSRKALPSNEAAQYWLALAAMAPQGCGFDGDRSFYRPITYFGRHGNVRAQEGTPFKKPIIMADRGALLRHPDQAPRQWAGKGISGHSAYADTVHQGYAPLLPVTGLHDENLL